MKKKKLKNVVVQGLGYVGSASLAAISTGKDKNNAPSYNLFGLDLNTIEGRNRIDLINKGCFPFNTADKKLQSCIKKALNQGRLSATYSPFCLKSADIVIVNVPLDIITKNKRPFVDFKNIKEAIKVIAENINPRCLVIIETTVPPGTCYKVILPIIEKIFLKRKIDKDKVKLAHSYERVMPGPHYLDSIINNWRVYSANNNTASKICQKFLKSFLNTKQFPLTKLSSMTASETAKIIENSYRATNIAFIEEWARFSEQVGINAFEIINAIRKRPTHNNIRNPGFGVGGYCLTKDPYFGSVASNQLFKLKELIFPFSEMGLEINKKMPSENVKLLKKYVKSFNNKKVLILGATYRSEVDDLRNSPTETFIKILKKKKAKLFIHDPYIIKWKNFKIFKNLPSPIAFDIIVIAVGHDFYKNFNFIKWLGRNKKIILDSNNIFSDKTRKLLCSTGNLVITPGRGDNH